MLKKQLIILFVLFYCALNAQQKVTGFVYDEFLLPFYNAKITDGNSTTTSDNKGAFELVLKDRILPKTLSVNAAGFQTEAIEIYDFDVKINIILKEQKVTDQLVISASRTPERIIESPVTISRLSATSIKKNTSTNFIGALSNLGGIDSRKVGYSSNTINTRGFSDFSNPRFVQMVDGMDVSTPSIDFSQGNFGGLTELDIESVEVLLGASSALYGANAYNGLMLINTKNPFDHGGVTVSYKTGFMNQDIGKKHFYDASLRFGYRFNESFAAKVNFEYISSDDWGARDYRARFIGNHEVNNSVHQGMAFYDGVNVYGDETQLDFATGITTDAKKVPLLSITRRTGYKEQELISPKKDKNIKFSTGFYYRPFKNDKLEAQFVYSTSLSDGIVQSNSSRYVQKGYVFEQSKLELKGESFYARGYYTRNEIDETYDLTQTGISLNNYAMSNENWLDTYKMAIHSRNRSFLEAREFADKSRPVYGTSDFRQAFRSITNTLLSDKNAEGIRGSKLYDRSNFIHFEGNYNFSKLLNKWADVQVGGSYRKYKTNSKGTIFNDSDGPIKIDEFGFYSQVQKKLLDEHLKLTTSLRYDKAENFEGNISPRIAINYGLGEDKDHVLRFSYQTGFRNPTIQEQYSSMKVGSETTIGTNRNNLASYMVSNKEDIAYFNMDSENNNINDNSFYDTEAKIDRIGTTEGLELLDNAILLDPYLKSIIVLGEEDRDDLSKRAYIKSDYESVKHESVSTFELGYRSLFSISNRSNLDVDFNAFYSKHKDFIFYQRIVIPNYGRVYPSKSFEGSETFYFTEKDDNGDPVEKFKSPLIDDNGTVILSVDAHSALKSNLARTYNFITNARSDVRSYGFGLALRTTVLGHFNVGTSYNYMDYAYEDEDFGFEPNFNTPKHSIKVQLGRENVFKNFGFNISGKWCSTYRWVSPYVSGKVGYIDAQRVLDAQLSYSIPRIKSKIKLGGTNLLGNKYYIAPGTGGVGDVYYLSWTIND